MRTIRKWLAIMGILVGNLAMGLSFSLINTNLESIHVQLGATIVDLQWMINIYGIFIASNLATMGRLGDIFGRKKIYLIGLILFAISMFGAGLAHFPGMIIFFQAIWGISGAILLPISQAMLVDIYPEEKKSVAIGIWAAGGGIALAIGPLVGGVLLNFLSWRWIFLINVPFAAIGFFLTALFAKESRTEGESTKIDWGGLISLTIAIGSFILATVQSNLWRAPIIVGLYAISVISLIFLLVIEKRVEMPIIREDLFKSRRFLLCSLGNFAMIAIFWAAIFLLPLYIQKQLQHSPLETGILMLGFAVPVAILSPLSGYLYNKVSPKALIFFGFLLLALSAIMQLQFGEVAEVAFIAIAILLLGMGFGLIWTPTTTGALSAISKNFAGIASGTFVTIQEIGGSLGLAITVTVVRKQSDFATGFHDGIWILLLFSIIGICSALLMKKGRPKPMKITQ